MGAANFWCRDFRKENFMSWLRNWSCLITSSSSCTLLLYILIFRSDVSQCLFCFLIGYIQQCHWLIGFSALELNFFELQNGKKTSSTTKWNCCVLSRCAWTKLKIFVSLEKFQDWTPALREPLPYKTQSSLFVHIWILFQGNYNYLAKGKGNKPSLLHDITSSPQKHSDIYCQS